MESHIFQDKFLETMWTRLRRHGQHHLMVYLKARNAIALASSKRLVNKNVRYRKASERETEFCNSYTNIKTLYFIFCVYQFCQLFLKSDYTSNSLSEDVIA